MASAQDSFNELLADRIAPWLRDRGFKRRDTTFRRERDGAWQIVNFQRSRSSDAGVVPFTVNLGVGLSLLHEEPPWASRGWPLEYECDFRQRLGPFYKGDDYWWRVRRMLPLGSVAKDVLHGLEDAGLSWLELHATPSEYLERALRDLSSVSALNLHSLVLLAKELGNADDVDAAEEELARWQRGERLANF